MFERHKEQMTLLLFSLLVFGLFSCLTCAEVGNDDDILGTHKDAYEGFKEKFKKVCETGTDDCRARKRHFVSNMDQLHKLKEENETDFGIGITAFMDWSPEEIDSLFIPRDRMNTIKSNQKNDWEMQQRKGLDRNVGSFDWRTTGALNPIRNQGRCGCCWAFAAVAAIETQYNHQNSLLGTKRRQFSEQFIVDCDTADWGCGGGFPQSAMRYVKKLGLVSRASYPYRSGQTGRRTKCLARKFKVTKRFRPLKNVKMLSGNIPAIIQFVRHQGPVAAGLWVCRDFMYYTHGIYSNRRCNASTSLGCHAMAIIGYGTDNERDYWLLRNQWGTNWGLNGYIKMARGVNTCQIETWGVSAPIV